MRGYSLAMAGLLFFVTTWVTTSMATADENPTPPLAKRAGHRETWHGRTFVDDYYWLREKSNPEVIAYLKAENAYTEAMTRRQKPLEEALYREMRARIKETDLSVPVRRGDYDYYDRTEEGRQYPVKCRRRRSDGGPEEVLLDLNELATGLEFFDLGALEVSDDGNLLAYTTDTTGFRQYVLHVKDLGSGQLLPDTAERVTSVQWAADNRTLFFVSEDDVTKRSDKLWRHTLGDAESTPVHDEQDELYYLEVHRTRDKKFVLLSIDCFEASEIRFLDAGEPRGAWRTILPRQIGHRYEVGHRGGLFYIVSNRGAKNFRVVTAPADAAGDESRWTEFVPHRDDVLVEGIDLFGDHAVVVEKSDAVNHLRTFDFAAGRWTSVAFPEPVYMAGPGDNEQFDAATYRYTYESPVTPKSVFDFDLAGHTSKLLKQQEVLGGYEPSKYQAERLWATARDGTRVPISIVYKKGVPRDGTAPLLLYGYGSYGAGLPARFSSERISLFDRGMIFALAHVRGGDDLGEAWRDAGILMQKKNTFNDFVDCAEHLVKEKWTSPERLAAEGGSAGGLLMGAVVNARPDLFRAVHLDVPFVDVINTMMDASVPLTTVEYLVWGNPNQKPAFEYILSYSPYDNLKRGDYPALLVTGSLNDSQVMYWEPAKYVAKLRPLKTDDDVLLLKTNMAAGHGGGSGRYTQLKEKAFEYGWILTQVGVGE